MYAYRLHRWAAPRVEEITQCKNDPEAKRIYQPPQIISVTEFDQKSFDERLKKYQGAAVSTPLGATDGLDEKKDGEESSRDEKPKKDMNLSPLFESVNVPLDQGQKNSIKDAMDKLNKQEKKAVDISGSSLKKEAKNNPLEDKQRCRDLLFFE